MAIAVYAFVWAGRHRKVVRGIRQATVDDSACAAAQYAQLSQIQGDLADLQWIRDALAAAEG